MNQTQDIEKSGIIKVILLFWLIRIFKPEWIISHYIPALVFLKPIPTILVFVFLIYIIFSLKKLKYDKPLLFFLFVISISTFFSANRGISIDILRGIGETFIIYSVMITALSSDKNIKKLFTIYLFAFALFGIWGIIEGGKIKSFMPLNNEDGFGPFMAMGICFAYYLKDIHENRIMKTLCFITFIVCIVGAVVSFARGTFLSILVVLILIFIRSDNKSRLFVHSIFSIVIFLIILTNFFPNFYTKYKKEMSTIWEQGAAEQTAKGRLYLWTNAWDMFVDYPLVGIGPGCFGFRLPRYTDRAEMDRWGVSRQLHGRDIHNIYFEIMAEVGFFGIMSFFIILYYFWKRNLFIRASAKKAINKNSSQAIQGNFLKKSNGVYYSLALEGAMIAFLVNGLFFNVLYFNWFWDFLILNSLIYKRVKEIES